MRRHRRNYALSDRRQHLALLFAVPVLGEPLEAATVGFSLAVMVTVLVGRRVPVASAPVGSEGSDRRVEVARRALVVMGSAMRWPDGSDRHGMGPIEGTRAVLSPHWVCLA